MPNIACLCNYCGAKFSEKVYNDADVERLRCPKCKDSNIKISAEVEKSDVFGYNQVGAMPDAYFRKKRE
jgi:hypothetical protein